MALILRNFFSLFRAAEEKSRGGQIRTDDILLPKQALYQAELRPVTAWADENGMFRSAAGGFKRHFQNQLSPW